MHFLKREAKMEEGGRSVRAEASEGQDELSFLTETLSTFNVTSNNSNYRGLTPTRAEEFKSLKPKRELQKRRNKMLKKQKDSRRDLTQQARNLALEEPAFLYSESSAEDESEKERDSDEVKPTGEEAKEDTKQNSKRKRNEVEPTTPAFSK